MAKTVELAAALADGLAEAHEKGIVHRDIKPGELFRPPTGRSSAGLGLAATSL